MKSQVYLLAGLLVLAIAATAGATTIAVTQDACLDVKNGSVWQDGSTDGYDNMWMGAAGRPYFQGDFSSLVAAPGYKTTITFASLNIEKVAYGGSGFNFEAVRATTPWTESSSSSEPSTAEAYGTYTTTAGWNVEEWYSFDITGLVQKWVDGTATNYGVGVLPVGSSGDFMTRGHASGIISTRPYFTVEYTTSPIPEPCAMVILATGLAGLLCYAWRKRK